MDGKVIYKRVVLFGELAGVGTLMLNHLDNLEYNAISQSVVALFGFPV